MSTERPILFSAPMVRAILAGTKSQTRRLLKSEAAPRGDDIRIVRVRNGERCGSFLYLDFDGVPGLSWRPHGGAPTQPYQRPEEACPYGVPGDRLWLREQFAPVSADGHKCAIKDASFVVLADGAQVYRDGAISPGLPEYAQGASDGIKWRPSIHMPRWASRLTLEVTGVRVERLQDITQADARAEGVVDTSGAWGDLTDTDRAGPRGAFEALWDSINGKRAPWASNPWVWVVAFRRVEAERKGGAACAG